MSTFRPYRAWVLCDACNYKHFVPTGLMTPATLTCFVDLDISRNQAYKKKAFRQGKVIGICNASVTGEGSSHEYCDSSR